MKRTVRLYGDLAKRFGPVHTVDAATPTVAVAAIAKLHPWRAHMPGQFKTDEKLRSEQVVPVRSRLLRK